MRLLLYGTLCNPRLLESFARRHVQLRYAVLRGWRHVALADGRYPTLRRALGHFEGLVVTVDHGTLRRLSAYEGVHYSRRSVTVWMASGPVRAAA